MDPTWNSSIFFGPTGPKLVQHHKNRIWTNQKCQEKTLPSLGAFSASIAIKEAILVHIEHFLRVWRSLFVYLFIYITYIISVYVYSFTISFTNALYIFSIPYMIVISIRMHVELFIVTYFAPHFSRPVPSIRIIRFIRNILYLLCLPPHSVQSCCVPHHSHSEHNNHASATCFVQRRVYQVSWFIFHLLLVHHQRQLHTHPAIHTHTIYRYRRCEYWLKTSPYQPPPQQQSKRWEKKRNRK